MQFANFSPLANEISMSIMVRPTYLRYNVVLLRAGGQYKIRKSAGAPSKIAHYFARVLANSLLLFSVIGLVADIKRKGPFEFGATAFNYGFICVTLGCMHRSIYYDVFEDKTKKLVARMKEFFKHETETGLEEIDMGNCVAICKKLTIYWLIYGVVCCLMFVLAPILYKTGSERNLPMPMWLPYDWKASPYYEITYFVQAFTLVMMAVLHAPTDMFFTASILLTAEQFKLLGWELKNLLYTSLINVGVPKETVCEIRRRFRDSTDDFLALYEICKSEQFNVCMSGRLKILIEYHRNLLAFCADMEDFFSPLMLTFFVIIMSIALLMNFLMIMSKDASLVVICLPMSFGAYLAILLPCFIANILSSQVEELQMDLYELPWYMCVKNCKSSIMFMHQKMNIPISLSVGKIALLNLPMFLWCVKTLNSYYIVLYQLTQSK